MIIAELLSYKADIICLQEVDAMIHDTLLKPVLQANGYQGYYSNKVSLNICESDALLSRIVIIFWCHNSFSVMHCDRSAASKRVVACSGRLRRLKWPARRT